MLIEVVATLAVLLLLVHLALPSPAPRTTPTRMLALVSASASLLRDTRTLAMTSNKPARARFDAANRRLESHTAGLTMPVDVGVSLRLGRDCRTGDPTGLVFWPDGTSCGGVLRFSKGGQILRARVNGLDGHVDIVAGG